MPLAIASGTFPSIKAGPWGFSFTGLIAYLVSNHIPFDLARLSWDRWQIFYIFLYYLIFSVPFFFSGLAISSALARWSALSGKLYFSDLTGAALGCLLILTLFSIFGGAGTLLFACLLGALASAVFRWMSRYPGLFHWVWVGFLSLLLFWQPSWMDLRLSPYKALNTALRFPGARLLETHWNVFSRVDVLESSAARTAPGLSLEYLDPLPPQIGLTVDGDQLNAITYLQGEPGEAPSLKFLDFLPSSFPYHLITPKRILVLEPKGGLEVLNALYHRAQETVIAEINPTIVELLRGPYRGYSGGLYSREGVQAVVEDGRSFIRRNLPSFDLIVFPLSESLGASSTGFTGLHEDYRLTSEAIKDYLKALNPGGFLCFHFYLLPPPRGEIRLVSTIKEALEQTGKRPRDHLLAYRTWGTFSLLVKVNPLVSQEIQSLKSFCQQLRFDLVYYPGISAEETNIYNRYPTPLYFSEVQRVLKEGEKFYSVYPFDVSPVTDDRPFFHYYFKLASLGEIYRMAGGKWQILLEGGFLVPIVFFLVLILTFFLIILPLILGKIPKSRVPGATPFPWLIYFLALGFGFMLVEISLIQKFILFLGHPVYSVSLVIFSLLVFAGWGSHFSRRFDSTIPRGLKSVLLTVAGLVFLWAFFLPQMMSYFQGQSLIFRQLLTVLLIAPLGLFMGMPFPLGIRLVGAKWPLLVPWGWCANGCASVLGSILPVIIALAWGFQLVFFLAALFYLLSFLVVWKCC